MTVEARTIAAALFAGAMTTGVGGSIASAAAEPLAVEPWSKTIGVPPPPYATPSPRAKSR